jgi:hypothetical protein
MGGLQPTFSNLKSKQTITHSISGDMEREKQNIEDYSLFL